MTDRVLLIRIEPTSYMLALIRALQTAWPGKIDTVFISRALSQPWEMDDLPLDIDFLPTHNQVQSVRTLIETGDFGLVHCAGWGNTACRAALETAHVAGIHTVVDLDTWKDKATGPKALIKKLILPRMLRKVTHFAPGGSRQAAFLRRYGVSASRITPINMTVDVTAIQRYLKHHPDAGSDFRKRHDLPADAPMLLFLGRLSPEKGVDDLLMAWPWVQAVFPNAHLVVAGDGPLREKVAAHASPSLHCLGRLGGTEVWNAYAAADIFVAPSRQEPWGLTINEAMACGLPIVMTDAFGSIGDLAVADKTACIIPTANPKELAAGMTHVLRDDAYASALSRGAVQRISTWTIEAEAQRIIDIWRCYLT